MKSKQSWQHWAEEMIHTTNLSRMLPKTQFLTPFTIRKCCVGNTKANEDFGEAAWMFIIALDTLCLKMGITLHSLVLWPYLDII